MPSNSTYDPRNFETRGVIPDNFKIDERTGNTRVASNYMKNSASQMLNQGRYNPEQGSRYEEHQMSQSAVHPSGPQSQAYQANGLAQSQLGSNPYQGNYRQKFTHDGEASTNSNQNAWNSVHLGQNSSQQNQQDQSRNGKAPVENKGQSNKQSTSNLRSSDLLASLPKWKPPAPVSEYKESFFNLYGDRKMQHIGAMITQEPSHSTTREQSKLYPLHNLDFIRNRRHHEIYDGYQAISEDVVANPRFYITKCQNNKFHIYDLMEIEKKKQKMAMNGPGAPLSARSVSQNPSQVAH